MAFAGGRPGMISAATGAMALLMVTLVKDYGLQYLLAATILTGALQIVAGWLRLGALMRFVSRSVITGFVTALAILIFMAQLPELIGVSWVVYAMVAAGLAIIYLFPYLSKAVPSPLVAIVVLTALALGLGLDIRTVGEMVAASPLFRYLPVHLLMSGKESNEACKQLEWSATTLTAAGFSAPAASIPGDAESVIARTVGEQSIDLLIMGAYSHSPLRSLLFGSKTADLLRSATIPTLLLR
jgi:SulP family sulfate permease